MLSGLQKSGGLSGEHIELCAEGARRKPNLSGKWTETQIMACQPCVAFVAVLLRTAVFIFRKKV
jgi:hypothetical protein